MLVTRPTAAALLEAIRKPRHGLYRLEGGTLKLLDAKHGDYRPVVLKNRALHVVENK